MRLAFAAFSVALGYALVYYAIGMYQHYSPTTNSDSANTQDLYYAFSYLLGFPNNGKFGSLPFKKTDMGSGKSYSTPEPTGNQQTGSGGGVQLV
jgi:hypothetical protein